MLGPLFVSDYLMTLVLIPLAPYPVSIPIKPVRVRGDYLEASVRYVVAVQVGRVRRDANGRIGRGALGGFMQSHLGLQRLHIR